MSKHDPNVQTGVSMKRLNVEATAKGFQQYRVVPTEGVAWEKDATGEQTGCAIGVAARQIDKTPEDFAKWAYTDAWDIPIATDYMSTGFCTASLIEAGYDESYVNCVINGFDEYARRRAEGDETDEIERNCAQYVTESVAVDFDEDFGSSREDLRTGYEDGIAIARLAFAAAAA